MTEKEKCPLCRNVNFKSWRFGLLGCDSCTLRVDPAVWNEQANEKLEEEWFGEEYNEEMSWWVRTFEEWNNRRTLRRIGTHKITGNKLLEIGVGSGSFLNFAKNKGFDVIGCDLSESICSFAKNSLGVDMHAGDVSTMPTESYYDLAVMNHILEHTNNPVGLLHEIFERIVPGGLIHLAVPNVDCFEACFSSWTSYEPLPSGLLYS